jgi:hypothetical protein
MSAASPLSDVLVSSCSLVSVAKTLFLNQLVILDSMTAAFC